MSREEKFRRTNMKNRYTRSIAYLEHLIAILVEEEGEVIVIICDIIAGIQDPFGRGGGWASRIRQIGLKVGWAALVRGISFIPKVAIEFSHLFCCFKDLRTKTIILQVPCNNDIFSFSSPSPPPQAVILLVPCKLKVLTILTLLVTWFDQLPFTSSFSLWFLPIGPFVNLTYTMLF